MTPQMLTVLLLLRRAPIVPLCGLVLLLAGSGLIAFVVPGEVRQVHALGAKRARLISAETATPAPNVKPARKLEKWASFQRRLGDPALLPAQLDTIYGIATQHGLQLSTGEYKLASDPSHAYATYEVRLPVDGDYRALRGFCDDVLLALPNATLDALSFKRESVGSGTLQAKTQFTLYLAPSDGTAGLTPAVGVTR